MNVNNPISLGSKIAKDGFKNEQDIVFKFNNWQNDVEAKDWLEALGHNPTDVTLVRAIKVKMPIEVKPDIQVTIQSRTKGLFVEGISIKLVSNLSGSNQIDKRWIDTYAQMWTIPNNIVSLLKEFTGEKTPSRSGLRDKRRTYFNEMTPQERNSIINFFNQKKQLILSDILQGRSPNIAKWMMVAQKLPKNNSWTIKPMTIAINHFGKGNVVITPQGGLTIGNIRVQRKGGDGGAETANKLQFKINPAELFKI